MGAPTGSTSKGGTVLLWTAAVLITLASAYYQRRTGPTYPVDGTVQLAGQEIAYSLERTHGGSDDQLVSVPHPDALPAGRIQGRLLWKRHGMDEEWNTVTMHLEGDSSGGNAVVGALPHQPPAGKLDYRVNLMVMQGGAGISEEVLIPAEGPITTRFKGAVPAAILVPHILLMFLAMLWSTRAGLEALVGGPALAKQVLWTLLLLIGGGMILGPLVQYYAFGALWTGVPFGWDLTDNKTLISVLGWAWAVWATRSGKGGRTVAIAAAVITLAVYLIPHSVLGSELDYSTE